MAGSDLASAKDNLITPKAPGFKPIISKRNLNNPNFNNLALGGVKQNTGKEVSSGQNKPLQVPSGFRTLYKLVKKHDFYSRRPP